MKLNYLHQILNTKRFYSGSLYTRLSWSSCIILLMLLPCLIHAQFTEIPAGLLGANSSAWGDYDNDGDLDIIHTGNSTAKIYRNDGNGVFVDIEAAGLSCSFNSSAVWGDYDNDGCLDILLIAGSGTKIFHNDRNGHFSDINACLPGSYGGSSSWGDYDNDGDLDVLLAGGTSKVYRNDGDGHFTDINACLPGVYGGSSSWGDYDNDGDLDILLTGRPDTGPDFSRIYRNDGNGVFADINAGLSGAYFGSVAWGDYNNDGNIDILLTGVRGASSKIYRNNGNNSFTDINAGLQNESRGSSSWGDYDNDGDLDILLKGVTNSKVYRNDGNGVFADINAGLSGAYFGSVAWGDYDNDGDLDILLAGETSKVYRNDCSIINQSPNFPPNLSVQSTRGSLIFNWDAASDDHTPPMSLTYNIRVGIESDNDIFVSSMSMSNGSRLLPEDGNAGSRLTYTVKNLPANETVIASVQAIDQTYRGSSFCPPITVQSPIITIPLPVTNATPSSNQTYDIANGTITLSWNFSESPTGDFADGYVLSVGVGALCNNIVDSIDVGNTNRYTLTYSQVYISSAYKWMVVPYNETGYAIDNQIYEFVTNNPHFIDINTILSGLIGSVVWGDYDNDGDLDILLTGATSGAFISKVYRNDGDGAFVDIEAGLIGVSEGSVAWGDYDNDGDIDILLTGAISGAFISKVYRNDGNNTFIDINAGITSGAGSAAWGDYNNDGDLDLLIGDRLYSNNNGSFAYSSICFNYTQVSSCKFFDFDNDGDLDIIVSGIKEYAYIDEYGLEIIEQRQETNVYSNSGIAFCYATSIVTQNYSTDNIKARSIDIGDYNGDGLLDVLIAGNNGFDGANLLFRNNGTSFEEILYHNYSTYPNAGCAKFGDFDNDGDLDIIQTGEFFHGGLSSWTYVTQYFRNDANTFIEVLLGLSGYTESSIDCGDFDSDGKLDFVVMGSNENGYTTKIFRNVNNIPANYIPEVPINLRTENAGDFVKLIWDNSTDNGSISLSLSYAIKIGTAPGANDVMSGMASDSGYRRISGVGFVNSNCYWKIHKSIFHPNYNYFWSVQAIDNTYAGSAFSASSILSVPSPEIALLSSNIIDCGSVIVDESSDLHTLTFISLGCGLYIGDVYLAGHSQSFEIVSSDVNELTMFNSIGTISIRFTPNSSGTQNDTLFIISNATNFPVLQVALTGVGLFVPLNTPDSLQISIEGGNAIISWQAVVSDIHDNPISPDGYLVFFNEQPIGDFYWFLTYTSSLSAIHQNVAAFRQSMFYRIVAVKLYNDLSLTEYLESFRRDKPVNLNYLSQYMIEPIKHDLLRGGVK